MFITYNSFFGKKEKDGSVKIMDTETIELRDVTDEATRVDETEGKDMTCLDFLDHLCNNNYFDSSIQEYKVTKESNVSEKLMKEMVWEATQKHVFLTDLNDFNYDTVFYTMYKEYRL